MDIGQHAQVNAALYQFGQTYLEKRGWFESLDGIPRNKEGVVPWITYPAFRQLQRILKPGSRVFEFGCGGSSLWWAANAAEVISVEHNAAWAAHVAQSAPPNLSVITREAGEPCPKKRQAALAAFFEAPPELPLSHDRDHNIEHGLICDEFAAYASEITLFEPESFDVVVVDGMARALTAWLAARYVKPDGVIVFDNSDRWQYNGAFRQLNEAGFRRIDYYGPGPVNRLEWCTSLFVKDLEVFARNVDSPPGDCDLGW
jgi:SAM-dependent methyltransferase